MEAGAGVALVDSVYRTTEHEVAAAVYPPEDLALISDKWRYYGEYIDSSTRPYCNHVLHRNLPVALRFLECGPDNRQRIFDLGCGLGNQSMIIAETGASVTSLDLSEDAIALARRRQRFHEQVIGRPLSIRWEVSDFLTFAVADEDMGAYDGLFSMSAFMHLRPLDKAIEKIAQLLRPGGRVFIWDLNPFWGGQADRRVKRVTDIARMFEATGFELLHFCGAVAIPRRIWRPSLVPLVRWLDERLYRVTPWPFGVTIGAVKI